MFKFRFQTILKVRKIRYEEAQQALAEAQRTVNRLERERQDCLVDIEHSGDELLQLFRRQVAGSEISMFYNYQRFLQFRAAQLETEIQAARRQAEDRRARLMITHKEFKAMERLKEIMRERYGKEQDRLEMKAIDDMAVTRHARPK